MTYSIVARDAATGELGVAVQSQAFNTGAVVPWARPGVGAIATQSFTDPRYGWRGLELLAEGRAPRDALDELLAVDEQRDFRQVGFLDAAGRTAQHTGAACVPAAGSAAGDGWAAQGNMLAAEAWHAMGAAFEATAGTLAQRLMTALDAAEAEGGDWRGRGGAGLLVVPATGDPWESGSSTCASRRVTTHWSRCGASCIAQRRTAPHTTRSTGQTWAARVGCRRRT